MSSGYNKNCTNIAFSTDGVRNKLFAEPIKVCTRQQFNELSNDGNNDGIYVISDDSSIYYRNILIDNTAYDPIDNKPEPIKIRYTHCKSCGAPLVETYSDRVKCEYCDTVQDTYYYKDIN